MTATAEIEVQPDADAAKAKKQPRPTTIDHTSQFCKSPDPKMHLHCRGSGANGSGRAQDGQPYLWFCPCDCHVEQPTCRDCGQRGQPVTLDGTCIDVDGCATTRMVRRSSNPVHVQLNQILGDVERREAEDKARKAADRAAQREREAAQAQAEGRPVVVRPARTPKAPPKPQRCHCGCAGMTKGGKFVAGHDAKLKGMLVRAARQTPPESGKPATKAQATNAMAELIARDWPRKGVNTEITCKADDLFNQYGPDAIIEAAVAARYEGKTK